MKIVVIGGHLTPALAVIEGLKEHELLFIGRKYALEGDKALSLEYKTVTPLGVKFKPLITGRLQRKLTVHTIPSLLKIPIGFVQSLFILKSFKPDRVVGFGGYVQIPVVLASFILKVPLVLHEQTLGAGLANRICCLFAKRICVSWQSSLKFFPKQKTVLTGNPIRSEISNIKYQMSNDQKENKPILYITGGSLGSHSINLLLEKSLKELLKTFRIIHQTGDTKEFGDFEKLSKLREELEEKKDYFPKRFLSAYETAQVINSARLVVSRAGINTITELVYLSKPCLLIPLLWGSEQKQNADFIKGLGLCETSSERDLTPTIFAGILESMLKNLEKYKIEKNILIRDAKRRIVQEILNAV